MQFYFIFSLFPQLQIYRLLAVQGDPEQHSEFSVPQKQFNFISACLQLYLAFYQASMIQVISCQQCGRSIKQSSIASHMLKCRAPLEPKDSSIKWNLSMRKVLNIDCPFACQYCFVPGFHEEVDSLVRGILRPHRILDFSVQLSEYQFNLKLGLSKQIDILDLLRDEIEAELGKYQVSYFAIPDDTKPLLDKIKCKYIYDVKQDLVTFISRREDALEKTISFFSELLELKKKHRMSLCSEVLQLESEKEKSFEDIVKSVPLVVANLDEIDIKVRKVADRLLVFICGEKAMVQVCKEHMERALRADEIHNTQKVFSITSDELKVLEKNAIIQTLKQKMGFKSEVKKLNIVRSLKVNSNVSLFLIHSPSILCFTKNTVIVMPEKYVRDHESLAVFKDTVFFEISEGMSVDQTLNQLLNLSEDPPSLIGILIPEDNKEDFLTKIKRVAQSCTRACKIYILERFKKQQAVDAFEKVSRTSHKYYVTVNGLKKYYSPEVSAKISSIGDEKVIVTSKEVKIQKKQTHTIDWTEMKIVHMQSGVQSFLGVNEGKYYTLIGDSFYDLEALAHKAEKLQFAIFQIDPTKKTQRNMLTNKVLHIKSEAVVEENPAELAQESSIVDVAISYPLQDQIDHIWGEITYQMQKHKTRRTFDVKGLSKERCEQIVKWCKCYNIEVKAEDEQLICEGYNQIALRGLEKFVEAQLTSRKQIQYPKHWVKDQPGQIDLIQVASGTEQFAFVQNLFLKGPIKRLQRVQNKILYEKYYSEKMFLSERNGAPVREKMMFHGTRSNDPALIYGDKEESFNINYANKGSYGKGIYFARDSQYSDNYKFASGSTSQMFLCLVLAGHSQIYNGSQILDTSYRDMVNKIKYESVISDAEEKIVVVFKNRRAYPLYLISY